MCDYFNPSLGKYDAIAVRQELNSNFTEYVCEINIGLTVYVQVL